MLIDDAYDFLIGRLAFRVCDGNTHQPAELSNTVIHVNEEVANLQFLQFLHRERHLARACLLVLQRELVETIENLVVGEKTSPQVVVGEAFVERVVNGDERLPFALLRRQEFPESFVLLGAVGQDIEFVAVLGIVGKRLRHQFHVFMEQRLWRRMEGEGGFVALRRSSQP